MKQSEAFIVGGIVLVTLWLALRSRAAATPATGGIDQGKMIDMMQPYPVDPKPIPTTTGTQGTPSDICRDYCAGRIQFIMDPGCNCQVTLPDERGLRIQI